MDDKIVYELNLAVPTPTFAGNVSTAAQCKQLWEQVPTFFHPMRRAHMRLSCWRRTGRGVRASSTASPRYRSRSLHSERHVRVHAHPSLTSRSKRIQTMHGNSRARQALCIRSNDIILNCIIVAVTVPVCDGCRASRTWRRRTIGRSKASCGSSRWSSAPRTSCASARSRSHTARCPHQSHQQVFMEKCQRFYNPPHQ